MTQELTYEYEPMTDRVIGYHGNGKQAFAYTAEELSRSSDPRCKDPSTFMNWLEDHGYVERPSIQFPSGRTYSTEGSAIKEVSPANQFRIGGIYRQRNGVVVRLDAWTGSANSALAERVATPSNQWLNSGGSRRLSDGRYIHEARNAEHECHLLPGELIECDGQWVRAEEAKPELARAVAFLANLPAIRQSAERKELVRSPLPNSDAWRYTDKRVDRWAGFVVDKMDINMPCDPWKNNRHALQRMSEGTNPTHGSALLLKD